MSVTVLESNEEFFSQYNFLVLLIRKRTEVCRVTISLFSLRIISSNTIFQLSVCIANSNDGCCRPVENGSSVCDSPFLPGFLQCQLLQKISRYPRKGENLETVHFVTVAIDCPRHGEKYCAGIPPK